MVKHAPGATTECCPHVDRNDPRCGHRFRLGRLEQAFNVCFGAYHGCPMYHRMNREAAIVQQHRDGFAAPLSPAAAERRGGPLIMVTANGGPLALRRTGS